jgi:prephenate dehydrogenase
VISGRILILGLGRTGASLGLALRARGGGDGLRVDGFDRDPSAGRAALGAGSIDRAIPSPDAADSETRLVVLAVPPGQAPRLLEQWGGRMPGSATVMDLSLLMLPSLHAVSGIPTLRERFVPAHPILSQTDPDAPANGDRFAGVTILVGGAIGPEGTANQVASLWRSLGANPLELAPALHDALVALTHHVPLLVSAAFVRTLRRTGNMTRLLAKTPEASVQDLSAPALILNAERAAILKLNGLKIVPALELLEREVRGLRRALTETGPELETLLEEAHEFRRDLFA